MSSGTSGCSRDGVVPANKLSMSFIEGNQSRLARDMSAGQGETLAGLASVLQVAEADTATFSSVLKDNYGRIFVHADMSVRMCCPTSARFWPTTQRSRATPPTSKRHPGALARQ
ncbi:MAG: DUF3015 family protein [Burkholderiales bacterium]|nr:DUF3015 family protein [Burkholderiales bacterium]